MFTGIVEELGEVVSVVRQGDSALLTVRARKVASDAVHGASIAVNGVCLTVVGQHPATRQDETDRRGVPGGQYPAPVDLDFDVMGETLRRSVVGGLTVGDRVNLERAARVDSRLDGHIVQGHVDGTGTVVARTPGSAWESVRFGLPRELSRYVAEKGSVAVNGVSLTVSAVGNDYFDVGLIPETLRATNLGSAGVGDAVNIEVDVLAKYTERLLSAHAANGGR
jgi:riboflavin synthase